MVLLFSQALTVWAGGQSDRKKKAAAPALPAAPAVPGTNAGEAGPAGGETGMAEQPGAAGEAGTAEQPPVAGEAGTTEQPPVAGEAGTTEQPLAAGEAGGTAENGAANGGTETPGMEPELPELTAEQSLVDMDIRTSTLTELAAWCRSLGLSEGGTREELASRLRVHFQLNPRPGQTGEEEGNQKTITIESARSTEYFTLDVVDEEYARLRGDVIVSLKDGEALHRITAREILYNRTRNLMSATGGVRYVKEEGETIETFRGENITINLDNWSSIFMDGVSEKTLQEDETTYRFAGTVISRSEEEVTVLNKAEITNATNDEAFWSLNASKLWLLPGSDFAIFNAHLKVGEIPVLYIPFFYFPADEVVFHPVLGFRSREGNFVQTTTYILGRPKVSSSTESSITKILGGGPDMEKVREGVFLRSTGKKKVDANEISLKAIMDLYANLGTYFGTELTVPKRGILSSFDLSGGIGITRDVAMMPGNFYTPFVRYDGTSDWNSSRLFTWDVPIRYRLKTNGSLSGRNGSLTWAIPFYSDPFVDKDFLNRSEDMDWVHMIQEGGNLAKVDEATDTTILGAHEWRLNGALTPSFPSLRPYVSTLSLSSFTSTVAFRTRESAAKYTYIDPSGMRYSPNRTFFFPDKFTLYSVSLSIAGTPLTLGTRTAAAQPAKAAAAGEDILKNIGDPRSPWEKAPEGTKAGAADPANLVPPALAQHFEVPRAAGPQFSIGYQINPSSASELQYRSDRTHWKEFSDIDWSEISSVLSTVRGDASTSFNLNHANGGAYTNTFRLSGTGSWQDYNYANGQAEEFTDALGALDKTKIRAARNRAYAATYFTTSYDFSSTLRPLYRSAVWGNSSLQYSFKGLLAKSEFKDPAAAGTGSSGSGSTAAQDHPEWEVKYGAWDKDNLDSHQFATNLAANVMDKAQTFTLTADLPPKDATLAGNATMRVWISETNARMRVLKPAQEDVRKPEPFYLTETLLFGKHGSFQQYTVLDTEKREYTTLTSNLSLFGFSAAYTAVRSIPYHFEVGSGWVQQGEEGLNSRDFVLGYNQTFKKEELWKKRLSFSLNVNSSMTFDLQRYTYSRLNFGMGFTLGINKFVDISLATTSENSTVYRYFKDIPGFQIPISMPEGDQNNFFLDLANSFRFDKEELRKSSGFKLKTFKLQITHHLGDWNAKLGMTLSPYLPSGAREYKFNNELSFVVQWIPISEIKTEMNYNKDVWTFK
ncbi:hypothetical protein AGMMS50268_35740 [Spirochaetia bacterium]|nr:hypothetical protein AGMMS50268_35740 [Spirochaetia bacterium]